MQNYFSGTAGIALGAGDVIDLAVGPNGDLTADSTGVDATIQVLDGVNSWVANNQGYDKTVKPSNSVSSNVTPRDIRTAEHLRDPIIETRLLVH